MVEGIEDWEEGFEDVDTEILDEVEIIGGYEGERFTRILQRILLVPREPEQSQEHEIFRTRCTINTKVCNVIVNGGSSEYIVSKVMGKVMGLSTLKHPRPYKVG